MTAPKYAILNIIVSLFFAAAILFADRILEGTAHNETVRYLIIAVWFIPFSLLTAQGVKADQACCRKEVVK